MFNKKTIDDINLQNKTVIFRPEFNVPIENGEVVDDFRIKTSMPSLRKLLDAKCRVIIVCSLGRPKGKVVPELDQRVVAEKLGQMIDEPVHFVDALFGEEVTKAVNQLTPRSVLMIQNMRFDPREESNDTEFARVIVDSIKPDFIVQDAFGNSHRKHATMVGINQYVPSVAGYLVRDEVEKISNVISNPDKPVLAIVGGAKLETKLPLLEKFLSVADKIVVAGVMANTLLVAKDYPVGNSLFEADMVDLAKKIMQTAEDNGVEIYLPIDGLAIGTELDTEERIEKASDSVSEGELILDFGDGSTRKVKELIAQSKTIIWNGPLGYFENEIFAKASIDVAKSIAEATASGATSIIGGGDTADLIHNLGNADKFTHVSTGGGASLELMAGHKLPAVEALEDKE